MSVTLTMVKTNGDGISVAYTFTTASETMYLRRNKM